jgi:hypothetical protein
MQVHYRDDENGFRLDGIKNAVRKGMSKTTPYILFDHAPCVWILKYAINRGFKIFESSRRVEVKGHDSSANQSTDFFNHLLTRHRRKLAGAYLVAPPNCFCRPKTLNFV